MGLAGRSRLLPTQSTRGDISPVTGLVVVWSDLYQAVWLSMWPWVYLSCILKLWLGRTGIISQDSCKHASNAIYAIWHEADVAQQGELLLFSQLGIYLSGNAKCVRALVSISATERERRSQVFLTYFNGIIRNSVASIGGISHCAGGGDCSGEWLP